MTENRLTTFVSTFDFFSRFIDFFRGPTYLGTFIMVNKKIRQMILITVSIANNCGG